MSDLVNEINFIKLDHALLHQEQQELNNNHGGGYQHATSLMMRERKTMMMWWRYGECNQVADDDDGEIRRPVKQPDVVVGLPDLAVERR